MKNSEKESAEKFSEEKWFIPASSFMLLPVSETQWNTLKEWQKDEDHIHFQPIDVNRVLVFNTTKCEQELGRKKSESAKE